MPTIADGPPSFTRRPIGADRARGVAIGGGEVQRADQFVPVAAVADHFLTGHWIGGGVGPNFGTIVCLAVSVQVVTHGVQLLQICDFDQPVAVAVISGGGSWRDGFGGRRGQKHCGQGWLALLWGQEPCRHALLKLQDLRRPLRPIERKALPGMSGNREVGVRECLGEGLESAHGHQRGQVIVREGREIARRRDVYALLGEPLADASRGGRVGRLHFQHHAPFPDEHCVPDCMLLRDSARVCGHDVPQGAVHRWVGVGFALGRLRRFSHVQQVRPLDD